ncbi:hypothetical protein GOP47_0015033 [Adiantum capillus-veneris]|uniref:Uncharacterized protein n=1 Tax=Adiantum capillus-veneris TaxID=13818 RepID=A0A9D4ZET6_ADICA|nr:hypothetical protein GOP47_0015033 [Adiantum capillus-veneris]
MSYRSRASLTMSHRRAGPSSKDRGDAGQGGYPSLIARRREERSSTVSENAVLEVSEDSERGPKKHLRIFHGCARNSARDECDEDEDVNAVPFHAPLDLICGYTSSREGHDPMDTIISCVEISSDAETSVDDNSDEHHAIMDSIDASGLNDLHSVPPSVDIAAADHEGVTEKADDLQKVRPSVVAADKYPHEVTGRPDDLHNVPPSNVATGEYPQEVTDQRRDDNDEQDNNSDEGADIYEYSCVDGSDLNDLYDVPRSDIAAHELHPHEATERPDDNHEQDSINSDEGASIHDSDDYADDHNESADTKGKELERDPQLPFDSTSFTGVENVPSWLPKFVYETGYFSDCPDHKNRLINYFHYDPVTKATKLLCGGLCRKAKSIDADLDILLQVRRNTRMNAIEQNSTLGKYFNTDGIQLFKCNHMNVIFLRSPKWAHVSIEQKEKGKATENVPSSSMCIMQRKGESTEDVPLRGSKGLLRPVSAATKKSALVPTRSERCCLTCKRVLALQSDVICCSIECKLGAMKLGKIPSNLCEVCSREYDLHFWIESCQQHNVDINKPHPIMKLLLKLEGYDDSNSPEGWTEKILERLAQIEGRKEEAQTDQTKKDTAH